MSTFGSSLEVWLDFSHASVFTLLLIPRTVYVSKLPFTRKLVGAKDVNEKYHMPIYGNMSAYTAKSILFDCLVRSYYSDIRQHN